MDFSHSWACAGEPCPPKPVSRWQNSEFSDAASLPESGPEIEFLTGRGDDSMNTGNKERTELVQLCLNGDDDAWARLVEEYRGLVYSICYLFCGSTQDAEDLVQDTFLKIWMNLASYDPSRGELKGWIATVTRNQRVDRYRRSGQQRLTDSI